MTPKEFQDKKINPDVPQFIHVRNGQSYLNRVSRGVQMVGGRDCAIFYQSPMIGTYMPLPIPIASIVYICPMDLHLECDRKYAEYCGARESGRTTAEQENHRQKMRQIMDWVTANNPDYLKYKPGPW